MSLISHIFIGTLQHDNEISFGGDIFNQSV